LTLTFDFEHLQRIVCDVMKLCTKCEHNPVICISVFDLITLSMCYVLRFHQVWPSTTYPCLNYRVFNYLWWYVEFLIILRIFAHVMSRRHLDLSPLDLELLQHFGCHAFKLFTKLERNRIIHGWVIDNLARFRRVILGMGQNWQSFLKVCGPNFTKLGEDIGRSSQHCTFVSEFGYLAAFSNAGDSNLSDVENDAKVCIFDPLNK